MVALILAGCKAGGSQGLAPAAARSTSSPQSNLGTQSAAGTPAVMLARHPAGTGGIATARPPASGGTLEGSVTSGSGGSPAGVAGGTRYTPASPHTATVAGAPAATATPITPAPPPFELCSPLANVARADLPRVVSDGYTAPPPGSDARHEGTDFVYYRWKDTGPVAGSPVQALLAGRVAAALEGTFPYGSFVIVETPNEWLPGDLKTRLKLPEGMSLYHLYAHMQDGSLQVALDEAVSACQPIGLVGKTGNTAAAHLHLETRYGPPGARFTQMSAFTETATPDEKRSYRLWRVSRTYLHFDPLWLLGYEMPDWPTPVPPFGTRK